MKKEKRGRRKNRRITEGNAKQYEEGETSEEGEKM
jgi:hypothetical protein